jgi:hypothetical protein
MAQILATGKQRAAKSSRVSVDGTALAFASWAANVEGEDIPTENFLSYDAATAQAYGEGILGFLNCSGDFGGDWDAGVNPIDFTAAAPPGLYPRDDLPNTEFYTSIVDGVFWNFPYLRIRGSNVGAQVKAQITFTANYKNQGVFDFPTGSV